MGLQGGWGREESGWGREEGVGVERRVVGRATVANKRY